MAPNPTQIVSLKSVCVCVNACTHDTEDSLPEHLYPLSHLAGPQLVSSRDKVWMELSKGKPCEGTGRRSQGKAAVALYQSRTGLSVHCASWSLRAGPWAGTWDAL